MSIKHIGTGSKIKKPWNFAILMFEITKSGFCYTNLEQISSRKFLNIFFKYVFHINDQKMAIITPIFVLMNFL